MHQGSKKHSSSRIFVVGLWIIMFLSSFLLIAFFAETFLRPPISQEIAASDWGGYVVMSDFSNPAPVYRSVSASWIVPTVNVSQDDTFCAVWIGIGGQVDDTLIQTGTEQDSISGEAVYSAWYELLPDFSITITTINVSAGDKIAASISLVSELDNQWLVEIADATSGQNFSQNFYYVSSRLSAEWIVERPLVNNTLTTLADFGSATFSQLRASTDSASGTATSFAYSRITMYDRQNGQLVAVSPLSTKGSTFTVTDLS